MGSDELGSFISGLFLAVLVFTVFCGSCDEINSVANMKRGIVYEGKIYHAVVDSVRTDSLHNWRKQ